MKRIFWLYPQSAAEREEEMCKLEQKNVEIEAWAGRQESAAQGDRHKNRGNTSLPPFVRPFTD